MKVTHHPWLPCYTTNAFKDNFQRRTSRDVSENIWIELFVCCCRRDIIFVKFFTPALENILGGTTVQPHTTPFTAINDRCVKGELTGWCGFPSIIILIIICGIASVGQCHFDTGMLSGRCHSRNVPHDKPDAASISMHFNSFCGWILETEKISSLSQGSFCIYRLDNSR